VKLGLLVERMGGKQVLASVEVVFRRDATDGPILGRSRVNMLDPRSSESTLPIEVTFASVGEVTIYAIIDPENLVAEHNEQNNIIQRTILVAPAAADQIPPVVERIGINGGIDPVVKAQQLSVDVTASDPTPGSGVSHVLIIEYVYSEGAQRWVPISPSGWLPFAQNPTSYRWNLTSLAGMRYLQVRARDEAGNISIGNARRLINYEAASNSIERGQTRIYRYEVAAGQVFEVNLEVFTGDADLYVWSSWADQSAWVSNLSGSANEQVRIAATQVVPGLYQVEVYGYTAATYRLTTNIGASPANVASLASGGLAEAKELPQAPVVAVASLPDERAGNVPLFELDLTSEYRVFLPLTLR
jgi:hypothetical protein